jgi:uncharacterized tellurite resistance protein B-like protein
VLEAIKGFFARRIAPPDAAAPGRPPSAQLAACALLLELAHADGEFSEPEQRHIAGALERHFGLDQATARELIALADQERAQSVDHFQFTRLVAEQYDLGQRMVLAEVMWAVILADGEIGKHEAYLVRKLANLLDLEPAYLAQARAAAARGAGRPPEELR